VAACRAPGPDRAGLLGAQGVPASPTEAATPAGAFRLHLHDVRDRVHGRKQKREELPEVLRRPPAGTGPAQEPSKAGRTRLMVAPSGSRRYPHAGVGVRPSSFIPGRCNSCNLSTVLGLDRWDYGGFAAGQNEQIPLKILARPAGLEPATLGLEGRSLSRIA
jgi:hypothetical protein